MTGDSPFLVDPDKGVPKHLKDHVGSAKDLFLAYLTHEW